MRSLLDRLARLVLASVFLLLARAGHAQTVEVATVDVIMEADATGRYGAIPRSTLATRSRETDRQPLEAAMPLSVGDIIDVPTGVRVQLRYASGERLLLTDGSRIELAEDRTVLQSLGEVYYQLRDVFRVQTGTVETVVEGTRFVVIGGTDAVRVRVDEGRVRVVQGDTEALVPRGRQVEVPRSIPDPPVPLQVDRVRLTRAEAWRAFPRGRPRLTLHLLATGGALVPYGDGTPVIPAVRASGAIRAGAGVAVGRFLRFTAGTAFNIYDEDRIRLPTDFGAALALPGIPVTFGGGPELTWERCTLDCGTPFRALHVGGVGWARGVLPLGPRVGIAGETRVSVTDVVQATGGLGVEVSL